MSVTTFKLPDGTTMRLDMHSSARIEADKGLGYGGAVQAYHTGNVLRRIQRYMPYRTDTTIKLTVAQTNIQVPVIVTDTPYARMLYYGISRSGKPLHYTQTHNKKAGPYWDKTLIAYEMPAMQADLQRFIRRRGG